MVHAVNYYCQTKSYVQYAPEEEQQQISHDQINVHICAHILSLVHLHVNGMVGNLAEIKGNGALCFRVPVAIGRGTNCSRRDKDRVHFPTLSLPLPSRLPACRPSFSPFFPHLFSISPPLLSPLFRPCFPLTLILTL